VVTLLTCPICMGLLFAPFFPYTYSSSSFCLLFKMSISKSLLLSAYSFQMSISSPLKLILERIEPETLREAHSQITNQYYHWTNPSGSIQKYFRLGLIWDGCSLPLKLIRIFPHSSIYLEIFSKPQIFRKTNYLIVFFLMWAIQEE
jgi:hypothetical protein